jgi:hypothetical protein
MAAVKTENKKAKADMRRTDRMNIPSRFKCFGETTRVNLGLTRILRSYRGNRKQKQANKYSKVHMERALYHERIVRQYECRGKCITKILPETRDHSRTVSRVRESLRPVSSAKWEATAPF